MRQISRCVAYEMWRDVIKGVVGKTKLHNNEMYVFKINLIRLMAFLKEDVLLSIKTMCGKVV